MGAFELLVFAGTVILGLIIGHVVAKLTHSGPYRDTDNSAIKG
jgi:hypothetical protein